MAWGMYKESHEPGPITLNQRRIIGINAKGEEQEIYHWQSGYSPLAFKKMFIKPMSNGDAEAARRLAKKINRRLDVPIISFRVESQVYTLTDAGVTREDSPPIIFDSLN
jgi:hypothetical protein